MNQTFPYDCKPIRWSVYNTQVGCFSCGDRRGLMMLAHHQHDKIVGWIFVCDDCLEEMTGKTLKVEVVDDEVGNDAE